MRMCVYLCTYVGVHVYAWMCIGVYVCVTNVYVCICVLFLCNIYEIY